MARYHLTERGEPALCRASVRSCPRGGSSEHYPTREAALAAFEERAGGSFKEGLRKSPAPAVKTDPQWGEAEPFTAESFFGVQAPRSVQLPALNAVVEALAGEEATQLVAACGTGKTYMSRQLMRHFLGEPGAPGVAVVLTSSVKLATDTAADLRPKSLESDSGYDHSLGKFGEDYEVIEVHSGARGHLGRQSVVEAGVVSVERIRGQWQAALAAGKKVVVVSTYDSCPKVVEAQALLEVPEEGEAALLIHDEAHNILGQQKATTVAASEGAEVGAYSGFHNSIPGALQARKRLYATATPVLREYHSDTESTGTVEAAVEQVELMKTQKRERVTFYSDDEAVVGRVSGFISQEEAVEAGCLAEPRYAVFEGRVRGRLKDFQDPVVTPEGLLLERSQSTTERPLSVATYGALHSTLSALVRDEEEGRNPATNVLAYVGSIEQAEAYSEHFRSVALARSGGLSLEEARAHTQDADLKLREAARMRLLAEEAEVLAAHSRTDSQSTANRQRAFSFFKGHAATPGEWTPKKRVLANVDIFSEGVSISEVDAVVVSDDEKCSERALTQAIGRSIRVVPGNSYKTTGHVIIPSVSDDQGSLTAASESLAAYGVTRVERAVSATKLRRGTLPPDRGTTLSVFQEDGSRREELARDRAREAVTTVRTLLAANQVTLTHNKLLKDHPAYREASQRERYELVKTAVREEAAKLRGRGEAAARGERTLENAARLESIARELDSRSPHEVELLKRQGRVLSAALAVGDVDAINPKLSEALLKHGLLEQVGGGSSGGESGKLAAKRKFLEEQARVASLALVAKPTDPGSAHAVARAAFGEEEARAHRLALRAGGQHFVKGGEWTPELQEVEELFKSKLSQDSFVEAAYAAVTDRSPKRSGFLKNLAGAKGAAFEEGVERAERESREAALSAAAGGEVHYRVVPGAVTASGALKAQVLKGLFAYEQAFEELPGEGEAA